MSKITIIEGNSNEKDNTRAYMVKGEKGEQGDLNHNDIIDNLTSTATNKVLSANQGKVLKNLVDTNIENISTNTTNIAEEIVRRQTETTVLQNQINSLASGSPLVASSISGMTDTSKVYVNTSDGKWYYYNGSTWIAGGTYQSYSIADDSIVPEQLKSSRFSSVFKFFTNNLKPISESWQSGAYNGYEIVSNTNAISCMNVKLNNGDIISKSGNFEFAVFKGTTLLRNYSTSDYTITETADDYAFIIVTNPRSDISSYVNYAKSIVGIKDYLIEFSDDIQNLLDNINISDLKNCNYVSEGDSITNRCNKNSSDWSASTGYTPYETPIINGYQNYVVNKLKCTLSNYGVEGWKITSGVNAILDRNYTNVDLVTIAYGVNDAREGSVLGTLGGYSDTTFDTSTFTGAYRTAINHILNDNPNCKIILMTPIQRGFINNFGTDTVNSQGLTMNDYRERIFEIAKIYSLPVCDCFAETEINNYNIKQLTIDGVHPNNAGYKCMGKLLCNIIDKL